MHLGASTRVDLLRREEVRAALLEALAEVDRLVLLGDVLELRHGPRREAMRASRPFFEDLGRVMAGREIVVSAGNHDHALVEPWLARRAEALAPESLGVEQCLSAKEASPMMAQLAAWAQPANVTVAYPGLWVRPDVYATHGHYLDCHLTVPTMERLGIGAMGRMLRRPAREFTGADDYEAVMAPVFAWIDAVAQQAATGDSLNGASTVRAWRALRGSKGAKGGLVGAIRTRALAGAFPLAVAALNRAGLGPVRADISTAELRRAGLHAMGEVARHLGVADAPVHLVFGHTHRTGPLPGDEAAEWRPVANVHLMNTGCWTYDGYFLTSTPGESPYWPGGGVFVEDNGPPVLTRLLAQRSHSDLQPQSIF